MDAFTFLLKTTILTIALIWGMQYKIDEKTIEAHFVEFVQNSPTVAPLHKVAQGARKASADGWTKFKEFIGATGTTDQKSKSESETTRKASTFKWQGE